MKLKTAKNTLIFKKSSTTEPLEQDVNKKQFHNFEGPFLKFA
jgi:hypothetical protein